MYWEQDEKLNWVKHDFRGKRYIDNFPDEPAINLSYYEAYAYAKWAGMKWNNFKIKPVFMSKVSLRSAPGQWPLDRGFDRYQSFRFAQDIADLDGISLTAVPLDDGPLVHRRRQFRKNDPGDHR